MTTEHFISPPCAIYMHLPDLGPQTPDGVDEPLDRTWYGSKWYKMR